MVHSHGLMVENMKDITQMVENMAMAVLPSLIGLRIQVNSEIMK